MQFDKVLARAIWCERTRTRGARERNRGPRGDSRDTVVRARRPQAPYMCPRRRHEILRGVALTLYALHDARIQTQWESRLVLVAIGGRVTALHHIFTTAASQQAAAQAEAACLAAAC